MTTIDQRILIPVRQDVVWAYVSDLRNNAEWQADCQGISFLSTKHDGVGTRWRSTTDRGKDNVLEVTTWYNGLGYEYVFVDGVALKNTKGRLRLQEIPEGTVVQWTFSFEGGGLLGASRTARQFDGTMAASLKALYKQLKALNQSGEIDARSLIREAPDVEARASYKPRHPSAAESSAESDEDAVLLPVDGEPTIGLQDAALVAAIDLSAEPPVAVEDTKPRPAVDGDEPSGDERFAPKPEPAAAVATPVTPPVPEREAAPAEIEPEPVITEAEPAAPPPDRTAAALAAAAAAAALPPTDSQGKSIWEVFGVERPSAEAEAEAAASAVSAESDKGDAPVLEADSVQVETAEPQPVEAAATVEPAAVPDPQETVPLEAVPSPAVTVPVVATVIAAVPDPVTSPDAPAAEPAVVVAPPAVSPDGQPRRGLRIIERRRRVNLRLPG